MILSWAVMVTVSTRNSVRAILVWSSWVAISGEPARRAVRWPEATKNDEGGVDGVLWPAVGACGELLSDFAALGAGAYDAHDLFADRVLLGGAGPGHGVQGRVGALLGAALGDGPVLVVGVGEAREKSLERVVGGGSNLLLEIQFVLLAVAALEDTGAIDDVPDNVLPATLGVFHAAVHGVAGFLTLGRGGRALELERFFGGLVLDDPIAEFVVAGLGDVDEDDRAIGAGGEGGVGDAFFGGVPAIADPDGDVGAGDGGRVVAEVEFELAGDPAVALQQLDGLDDVGDGVANERLASAEDLAGTVLDAGLPVAELLVPFGILFRLQVVFAVVLKQDAIVYELVEEWGKAFADVGSAAVEIADEEVGKHAGLGAEAEVAAALTGKFSDQEDEAGDASCECTVGRAVVEVQDGFVEFAEQHFLLNHAVLELLEDVVAGDDGTDGLFGDFVRGVVDEAQLGAEHAAGTAGIDCSQSGFPEAASRRQQRVVRGEVLTILGAWADLGAFELA